eukprot:scaffold16662_cov18-Tisochrysis_lutea.AAC.1
MERWQEVQMAVTMICLHTMSNEREDRKRLREPGLAACIEERMHQGVAYIRRCFAYGFCLDLLAQ